MLFAVLAAQDVRIAALFADVVQQGPHVLNGVSAELRGALAEGIVGAFRGAFLTIAGFSFTAMVLAWSLPMRRL